VPPFAEELSLQLDRLRGHDIQADERHDENQEGRHRRIGAGQGGQLVSDLQQRTVIVHHRVQGIQHVPLPVLQRLDK
jgi:hypothetical protein